MLVKVAYYASSISFFGEIMLELCSFFQIMPLFFKLCSLKKLHMSPKITSVFFLLEAVGLQERNATNPQ